MLLSLCWQSLIAQTFEVDGVTYTPVDATTCELTDGTAATGDFTVPEKAGDYTVTAIGTGAFAGNSNLTGIKFPSSLTLIKAQAFEDCPSLTGEVALNKGITVESGAFTECPKVRYLLIKGTPKSIASGSLNFSGIFDVRVNIKTPPAFDPTDAMVVDFEPELDWCSLCVPEGCVSAYMNDSRWGVFGDIDTYEFDEPADEGGEQPVIPDPDDPDTPQPVEGTLFVETAGTLSKLITGDDVSSTTSLALSGSLNGDDILFLRNMAGAELDGMSNDYGNLAYLDLTNAYIVEGGGPYYAYMETNYTKKNEVGNNMFSSCHKLVEVKLPKNVTTVGANCFSGAKDLTRVLLGEKVKTIGQQAFYMTSLEELDIPDGCESIADMAFYAVSTLKRIHLPASLKSLKLGVFYFCTSLDNVVIPDGVKKIEDLAFFNCRSLSAINIPAGCTDVNLHAFARCSSMKAYNVDAEHPTLSDIDGVIFDKGKQMLQIYPAGREDETYTMPASTLIIQNDAFWEASHLKSVTTNEALETIGNGAFYDCASLEEVNLNEGLKEIMESAFAFCANLKSFDIPAGIETLGEAIFCYSGLESLMIPEGIKTVPDGFVEGCDKLQNVTLPSTCTFIGHQAMSSCSALTKMTVNATTPPEMEYGLQGSDEEEGEEPSSSIKAAHRVKLMGEEADPQYTASCFNGVDCANCTLVVPGEAIEAYAAHPIWKQFNIDMSASISEMEAGEEAVEYFNMGGSRIISTQKGLKLVRMSNGNVRKMIVK